MHVVVMVVCTYVQSSRMSKLEAEKAEGQLNQQPQKELSDKVKVSIRVDVHCKCF